MSAFIRIGICDDDEAVRNMVSEWLKTRPEVIDRNIHTFSCGEALLEHLRLHALDIVFLDCKMNGLDGIDTAKAIRTHDCRLIIILLTGFVSYAMYGYGADILDFILKTEFSVKASSVFSKAIKRIKENDQKTYAVKTGTGLYHLNISEILYIESHARIKELITSDGRSYEFYGRINDVEKDLREHGFIRPHNSYLVNSAHIRIITPDGILLSNYKKEIPVSRGKYKQAYDDMTIHATESRL